MLALVRTVETWIGSSFQFHGDKAGKGSKEARNT